VETRKPTGVDGAPTAAPPGDRESQKVDRLIQFMQLVNADSADQKMAIVQQEKAGFF